MSGNMINFENIMLRQIKKLMSMTKEENLSLPGIQGNMRFIDGEIQCFMFGKWIHMCKISLCNSEAIKFT
jgi:hypothetical protein